MLVSYWPGEKPLGVARVTWPAGTAAADYLTSSCHSDCTSGGRHGAERTVRPRRTCMCARSAVPAMNSLRFLAHLRKIIRLEKPRGISQDAVTVV